MAWLKITSSLPVGKHHSLYVRFSRTNATVSKVHTLFNCCILRKAYFRQCSWHCLKTLRVCKSKHRLLIALFHWRFKSAAIRQSSTFDKVCGCRIYRNNYALTFPIRHISTGIVLMSISRLKNTYKQIASIREHGTEQSKE